jgi:heme-degrading monooxygenase HmoA
MALISITRLRVRSFRYLPGFIFYALLSARQAKRALGNLGVGLLRDADRTFWTRTAWRDEAAMEAFMVAKPHRSAMAKLVEWCNEASVVHWTQESPDLPNWHEAHRKMVAEGRRSRVRHPSRAHETYSIAPPKVS